jgi:hypothetical protein
MFRPVSALPRGEIGRSLSSGRKGLTPKGESRVHIEARKWKQWNAGKAIFLINFMDRQVALYSVQRWEGIWKEQLLSASRYFSDPPIQWAPEVKRPGCEADQSLPSSGEGLQSGYSPEGTEENSEIRRSWSRSVPYVVTWANPIAQRHKQNWENYKRRTEEGEAAEHLMDVTRHSNLQAQPSQKSTRQRQTGEPTAPAYTFLPVLPPGRGRFN